MIARPARVRIRSRKPWVLDRRRLFGWNVRLLTRYSHYTASAGRIRRWGGARGARGRRCAAPWDPRKLVAADGMRPQTPASITEETRRPTAGRIPTAHDPPDGPRCPDDAPRRRARKTGPIVARLWMGLLASPSLRVGRQGHDAWADPVGQPTAEPPVLPHQQRVDLQLCDRRVTRVGTRHDVTPAVHSLWTPVWTQCGSASTGRVRSRWMQAAADGSGSGQGSTANGRTNGMADATLDLATVWDQIRERLATSLSPQQNAMLNLTRPLGLVEDTAVLAAPNEFTQTVLESRMRRVLAE